MEATSHYQKAEVVVNQKKRPIDVVTIYDSDDAKFTCDTKMQSLNAAHMFDLHEYKEDSITVIILTLIHITITLLLFDFKRSRQQLVW